MTAATTTKVAKGRGRVARPSDLVQPVDKPATGRNEDALAAPAMTPTLKRASRVNKKKRVAYHKIEITDDGTMEKEMVTAAKNVTACMEIRERYQNVINGANLGMHEGGPVPADTKYMTVDGVVYFEGQHLDCIGYGKYVEDINLLFKVVNDGPTNSVCRNRLKILDEKYSIFIALNGEVEEDQCNVKKGGGLFSQCVKVDNGVRLSTAMHAQDLVDFITEQALHNSGTVVQKGATPEKDITLKNFLEENNITEPQQLTVEGVGLHPPANKCFHRFDIFSPDLNRGGERSAKLLKLFLKRDGPYYHELVRPILERNDAEFASKKVCTEYKLPLFGNSPGEWKEIAKWVRDNGLGNKKTNRWIMQIPRLSAIRMSPLYSGFENNQQLLDNIFAPMWAASLNPTHPENKAIAELLNEVGGFNVISDEAVRGQELPKFRPPSEWPWHENPPDLFFNYYLWANIVTLNHLRRRNGLNTFQFRPNCGEKGSLHGLIMGYVLAASINHGLLLERSKCLQYLFYMSQVGIVLSPLQNNGLGTVPYAENPFLKYQKRGMRVSLGTEDPLHYHHSNHAMIEEYGTAAKLYKLRPVDITEIARNSVLNSNYPRHLKKQWLGDEFDSASPALGNDHDRSFVPDVRLMFREDTLNHERRVIRQALDPTFTVAVAESQQGGPSNSGSMRRRSSVNARRPSMSDNGGRPMNCSEEDVDFVRVEIVSPVEDNARATQVDASAGALLAQAVYLRSKYVQNNARETFVGLDCRDVENLDEFRSDKADYEIIPKGGVFRFKKKTKNGDEFEPEGLPCLEEYRRDCEAVHNCVDNVKVKTFAHKRLQVLEHKFALHMALNFDLEHSTEDGQSRDFYQASKVDTHIHAAAGMTARQLLDFIQDKAVHSLDDIVQVDSKTKKPVTLRQLFQKMNIHPEALSVDMLNVQADASLFERFDNFNDKYNPMGNPDLRNLLLKTDNYMGGRYFAEIAKSTFAQYLRDEYTYAEMRLSIYGRNSQEWTKLAAWFDTHGMSCTHNKWMVQVPRIYPIFRKHGAVSSFQDVLTNVFKPLWDVSMDPSCDPKLHHFLKHVSGFDSVDNESSPDAPFKCIPPSEWTSHDNPPYGYWMYFMWANIRSLNTFRAAKGLTTFSFRPHCGESGSVDHLLQCHLVADQINHGVNLRLDPVLEYLYYLTQTGIAVSPLSNNSLFLDILDNPFPKFFRRGLNVSLSTDDPLQFHYTQEPLIEEYSIASKVWKFCANDMCEIARNSVRQSGFDVHQKAELIGNRYLLCSSLGNDPKKTHLSHIRVAYRYEVYHAEIDCMEMAANECLFDGLRSMLSIDEEKEWLTERERARSAGLRSDCDSNSQRMIFGDEEDVAAGQLSPPSPSNFGVIGAHYDPARTRILESENTKLREELAKMKDMISTMQQQMQNKESQQRLQQMFPGGQQQQQAPPQPGKGAANGHSPSKANGIPHPPERGRSLSDSQQARQKPRSAGISRTGDPTGGASGDHASGTTPPRRDIRTAGAAPQARAQPQAPAANGGGVPPAAADLVSPGAPAADYVSPPPHGNGKVVPFDHGGFGHTHPGAHAHTARPGVANPMAMAGMNGNGGGSGAYRVGSGGFSRTHYAPSDSAYHHYNGRQVPPPPPSYGFPKIPRSANGTRKPVGPMLDRMLANGGGSAGGTPGQAYYQYGTPGSHVQHTYNPMPPSDMGPPYGLEGVHEHHQHQHHHHHHHQAAQPHEATGNFPSINK